MIDADLIRFGGVFVRDAGITSMRTDGATDATVLKEMVTVPMAAVARRILRWCSCLILASMGAFEFEE
jgi:hypothetical protein